MEDLVVAAVAFALDIAFKATVLLALTALTVSALSRRSAAVRQLVATLGLAGALGTTRMLSALLFGVAPRDPGILLLTTGVLFLAVTVSALLAARQATRVAPLLAMRGE